MCKETLEKPMEKFWSEFWRLLEESVIVQSTVTLMAVSVTAYMVLEMRDVPKEWWTIMGIIIGFWFGSKVQIAEKSARRETAESINKAVQQSRRGVINAVDQAQKTEDC